MFNRVFRIFLMCVILAGIAVGVYLVYRNCVSDSPTKNSIVAYAEEYTETTSPILDLQQDPEFKISDYPYVENDKTLTVLQIAESKSGKLFIYVYHPGGMTDTKVLALHLNMSVTRVQDKMTAYNFYALTPLVGEKTIQKYVVEDFYVKSDIVRYYDIPSVTRTYIAGVDDAAEGGNTKTEKSFPVGQLWTVSGIGSIVEYSMLKQEVIEVTSKYVGRLRYDSPRVDNHIIAFSTDKDMETVYEIELSYYKWDSKLNEYQQITSNGPVIAGTYTVVADQKESVLDGGKKVYSWNKIQTSQEFLKAEKLTDSLDKGTEKRALYDNVKTKDWVIRFLTTPWEQTFSTGVRPLPSYTQTSVSNTCILKIKYETDGQVYDMGVVDDVQSGSSLPPNYWNKEKTGCEEFMERITAFWNKLKLWVKIIIYGVAALIVVIVVIKLIKLGFGK